MISKQFINLVKYSQEEHGNGSKSNRVHPTEVKRSFLESFNQILSNPVKSYFIKPFHDTDLFRYPLKTSENLWFSVFRGIERDQWHEMSLKELVMTNQPWNEIRSSCKKLLYQQGFVTNKQFIILINYS